MTKVHSHRAILLKDLHIRFHYKWRLRFISDSKLRRLLKNWIFWLILITGLAFIIRSLPAWINAAWGCDFGIYFGITKSVAQSGLFFPPYAGWGGSYNEFPVLYAITAFAHWISGIDIIFIMPKLIPLFGGLSVLIFYFVARELTNNKKLALICTLFFAFMPFHVYQTSHASPLTMGHFFIILSLYLFLKYRQNTKYIIILMISTMLLIMSHHLSTYFYLISLIAIVFVENAGSKEWTSTFRKDILYIIVTSLLVFAYWALIAKTIFDKFISGFSIGGLHLESVYIIIIFYAILGCLFGIIKYIRRFNDYSIKLKATVKTPVQKFFVWFIFHINPFVKKDYPTTKSRVKLFISALIVMYCFIIFFTIFEMPWTGFAFTLESDIYMLPLVLAIAFGVAGFRYIWYIKNGLFIRGWIIALALSFVFMLITNNTTIFPHRHPEYIMAPLAILTAFGIGGLFSDPFYKGVISKLKSKENLYVSYVSKKIKISQKNRLMPFFIAIMLVTSLAVTTYEVHKALEQSSEEITNEDLAAIEWMGQNLNKNTSLITSDHQLERMAEAEGFNTTEDEIIKLWSVENLSEYIDELLGFGKHYNRVTHVIINDKMKNELVHIGPEKGKFRTVYMTNETWNASYEKFKYQPFELIYRNETISINPATLEPVHWTEIYRVNWTYIESVI